MKKNLKLLISSAFIALICTVPQIVYSMESDDNRSHHKQPPHWLLCPISSELMEDPVIDSDGNTFERSQIEAWLKKNSTSPITRNPIKADDLRPNRRLQEAAEGWAKENSTLSDAKDFISRKQLSSNHNLNGAHPETFSSLFAKEEIKNNDDIEVPTGFMATSINFLTSFLRGAPVDIPPADSTSREGNQPLNMNHDNDDNDDNDDIENGWEDIKAEEEPRVREEQLALPLIVRGYEEIYQRFLNGRLVYKPHQKNDIGKIEMRISDLTNPLDGTFDLSQCGNTGNYFSISTGYRKEKKPENANKIEIWFTPRFLVEKEIDREARHLEGIFREGEGDEGWWESAPVGIFLTRGDWDIGSYYYLTNKNMQEISADTLFRNIRRGLLNGLIPHDKLIQWDNNNKLLDFIARRFSCSFL